MTLCSNLASNNVTAAGLSKNSFKHNRTYIEQYDANVEILGIKP